MKKNQYLVIEILFIVFFLAYGGVISYGLINWTFSYVVFFPFAMFLLSLFVREAYEKYTITIVSTVMILVLYYFGLFEIVAVQPELNRVEIVAELDSVLRNTHPYFFNLSEPERLSLLREGVSDTQFMWELEQQKDLILSNRQVVEYLLFWVTLELVVLYVIN